MASAPLIMPHIPPWNPSRHQSEKSFGKNQTHVWWHTTKHISPPHTQTSPQLDCPLKPPTLPSRSLYDDQPGEDMLIVCCHTSEHGCMPLLFPSTISCYNPPNFGNANVNLGQPKVA
ncbi:hypothetical protein O181_008926 [Austropuccinia psidii MF-1]|uniref:Uncharacterized protein n=1 Tax=Austropuccinia psidii MF-1 TaxID=1389203 RepID=A0A9Q3GIZ8_9BASI|nr:hypothetical protein [Austropuccinia psidii MF-1]